MEKPTLRRLLAIGIITLALLFILPAFGLADAGNFHGEGDFSFDSSSGSSGDGLSRAAIDAISGGLSQLTRAVGQEDASASLALLWTLIVLFAGYYVFRFLAWYKRYKKENYLAPLPPSHHLSDALIQPLRKADPGFSKQDFLLQTGQRFLQIQRARQDKDLSTLRALTTEALFKHFSQEIAQDTRRHRTHHIEQTALLTNEITNYKQDATHDILTVRMQVRAIDYITQGTGDTVVAGSRTRQLYTIYEWTLIRSKMARTAARASQSPQCCPHCGAPVAGLGQARCAYCDSRLQNSQADWRFASYTIRSVSQKVGA
ncbi:TIM44-like domain-containing protein [Luoshenia tenuis]|uniref:TIM44-like domain-containing protein n=1 Tax=Luoshenia tenuis TaxID=2763654 RepID=UPI003D8FE2D3